MNQKITPFLWFNNYAEEAINFYISLFPQSKIASISRYLHNSVDEQMKKIDVATLKEAYEGS